jgi:hypothetical protein
MKYIRINKQSASTKLDEDSFVFTSFEVMEIIGIARGRYNQWYAGNYLPSGKKERWGERTKTFYSYMDLYSIALFKKLVDLGLSRESSCKLYKGIDWKKVMCHKFRYFIIPKNHPNDKNTLTTTSMNLETKRHGTAGWYVDLLEITNTIRSKI